MTNCLESLSASQPSTISASMLEGVQAREDSDWQRFVEKYSPLVYRWCRQAGLQPADAAEVTQDTFLAVLRHVSRFSRADSDSTFRGWLWTIAHRKICDQHRLRGRWLTQDALFDLSPPATEELSSVSLLSSPMSNRLAEALEAVRSRVEPRSWLAFWRTVVDLQSSDEVARQLGLSCAAVRQAKYRTLLHLRAWWAEHERPPAGETV